jgi:predicted SPOUT superfamily RNA methylase MTH1
VRNDEYRVGLVVKTHGKLYVDVGLDRPLPFEGDLREKSKIIVRIKRNRNEYSCREVQKNQVTGYWGYDVKFVPSLFGLLRNDNYKVLITSKEGNFFRLNDLNDSRRREILILFGSPKIGVRKILESEKIDFRENLDYTFNMFPYQGTDTVRLEEAVLGTLSIINYSLNYQGT